MDKKILRALSCGVYIVGVKGDENPSACIVNTVFQVSADMIAVSICHDSYTYECIKEYGIFTVSVVSQNASGVVVGMLGFDSGKNQNKLKHVKYDITEDGLPIVHEDTCCYIECQVKDSLDIGRYTLFVAKVIDGSDKVNGIPMTYQFYNDVLKGVVPENSPIYYEDQKSKGYICPVCGYEYDFEIYFEQLPDTWVCPICGMPKKFFKKGEL